MALNTVDRMKLDACLSAEADAIRAKTGDANDIPFDFANDKGFADAIEAIPSGTTIADGIVFTSVAEYGRPITADIYGINVPAYCFGSNNGTGVLGAALRFVNFKSNPTRIGGQAFAKTAIEELIVPDSVTTFGGGIIRAGTNLRRLVHENAGSKYGYNGVCWDAWRYAGAYHLEEMVLGAVGKPVTAMHASVFTSFGAPSTAVIKIYCLGTFVDTCLSALRSTFSSQQIVFYAAEATTYNGTSYAAGDTILTSEVESTS